MEEELIEVEYTDNVTFYRGHNYHKHRRFRPTVKVRLRRCGRRGSRLANVIQGLYRLDMLGDYININL